MSDKMNASVKVNVSDISERTIRDLVDRHPDVLAVLGPLGIDLCCGGAYPLGEALDLHGIEREPVLRDVVAVVIADEEKGS